MGEESKDERLDRELIEFLNELRVTLPGVQVLFAFLLTVPFTNQFRAVTASFFAWFWWGLPLMRKLRDRTN